ncbi:hypothetical protein CK203_056739 [Vitis vinifera]|uniref:Endonuclease/exonuclease/phosphatase domain-containing protein n=1 Tax=Vitis vinifera TaxID=29760 RepID=A0A438GKH6_VITVI|nr:hypothetical protein CK203_056739 [Vitis vinifera]
MSARGAAGGVVVFWDKRVLELVGMEVGIFSISCCFKNCEDGFLWTFMGVYGPTLKRYRELFWEELGAIRGLWSDPWCIGGDFNAVKFPSERSREGRLTGSMRRFSEVIEESRLDRFLVSEDWENHFSGAIQSSLPRPVSDHFPILLDGGGVRSGPSPFRFENMWLKEEGFKELLKGWWQGFNYSGSYSFILTEKLKALKIKLKDWNREVFGKVGVNKRLALEKVSYWDNQERLRVLNEQELEVRKEAREDFKKWALMEEISWRQKSREIWLKEEPGGWRPCLSSLEFDSIGVEEAARLEEMFSVEEVFSALAELNEDKASGPDGFSFAFWQFYWDFVKVEVMGFFKDFFERGKFVRSLNNTFLVLIPKKGGAEDLSDFRPINLVGSLYKLLAKRWVEDPRVREGYGVGLLKEISKEVLLLLNNVSFSVGDGKRVRFWKDIWCGNISLCEAFPSLYDLVVSKDAWVADCWDSTGEEGGWNPCFLRPFNDWEMEECSLFPWKIIWCPYVPTKVGFFAWEASWGRFLLKTSSRGGAGEDFVGSRVFSFGVNWVLPLTARDTLLGWHITFKGKKHRKVWRQHLFAYFGWFGRKEIG